MIAADVSVETICTELKVMEEQSINVIIAAERHFEGKQSIVNTESIDQIRPAIDNIRRHCPNYGSDRDFDPADDEQSFCISFPEFNRVELELVIEASKPLNQG